MEGPPKRQKYFESVAGKFETVEPERIAASDILVGDRAFIVTVSGNRYMLRRSKSNGDRLMVYNERTGGFAPDSGRLLGLPKGRQWIAEKGQPFNAYQIEDPDRMTGSYFTSTAVVDIRIFRGLDVAANSKPHDPAGSWGRSLAKEIGKIVRGKEPDFDKDL